MQYLRALQKRSIFLWRSLFSGQPETGEKLPVYIERPSAARAAEGQEDAEPVADAGAAVPDRKENRPIIPAREAKTGAVRDFARPEGRWVLQGLAEAETRSAAAAERRSGGENGEALPGETASAETGTEQIRLSGAPEIPAGEAPAGAEELLEKLRGTAAAGRRARWMEQSERGLPALPQAPPTGGSAGPAEISAWFEMDARRYDGGYEVM